MAMSMNLPSTNVRLAVSTSQRRTPSSGRGPSSDTDVVEPHDSRHEQGLRDRIINPAGAFLRDVLAGSPNSRRNRSYLMLRDERW